MTKFFALGGCICALVAGVALSLAGQGAAPKKPAKVVFRVVGSETSIRGRSALVSLVLDGKVVKQTEEDVSGPGNTFDDVPAGAYEIRVEGAGLRTLVKRNLTAVSGEEHRLQLDMVPGPGTTVIQYAGAGSMTQDEIAARFAKAEAEIAALKKKG